MIRLEGNIKYNASTTMIIKSIPWFSQDEGGEEIVISAESRKIQDSTDENTLNFIELHANSEYVSLRPKEAAKFFSLTIKLRTLMIIKKHCT